MTKKANKKVRRGRKASSFRAWARNVIYVGRLKGYDDAEIAQWVRVYAKKRKIPMGTYNCVLSDHKVGTRPPYKPRSTTATAAMGRRLQPSPKMRLLLNQFQQEIKKWQISIIKTLREVVNRGESLPEARKYIIAKIEKDWPLSDFISVEEFIKRTIPELQDEPAEERT